MFWWKVAEDELLEDLDMLQFDTSMAQMDEEISPYGISDLHLFFEDYNCVELFVDSSPNLHIHLILSDVHGSIQEFRHFDGYRWELVESPHKMTFTPPSE